MRHDYQVHWNTIFQVLLCVMWFGATTTVGQKRSDDHVAPTTIAGRVIDAEQRGVAQAVVSVTHLKDNLRSTSQTTTDKSGAFAIEVHGVPAVFPQWEIVARTHDAGQIGFFRFESASQTAIDSEIQIEVEPTKQISIRVVDAASQPVADAQAVVQFGFPHFARDLSTDSNGQIVVVAPTSERVNALLAWKDGVGLDYAVYAHSRAQRADLNTPAPEFPTDGETLQLAGATPVSVHVTDADGAPIEGARLYPWLLRKQESAAELNLSFFADVIGQTTDASGAASFAWMPQWQTAPITLWSRAEGFAQTRAVYDPAEGDGELKVTLDRLVSVRGKVLDASGKPAPGITIDASGQGYGRVRGRDRTTSATDGTFELRVPPEQLYMLTIADDAWVADAIPSLAVNAGKSIEGIVLKLRKPTRLTGRLRAGPSGHALENQTVIVYQYGDALDAIEGATIANPMNLRIYVRPLIVKNTRTDNEGRYEFLLGNGSYDIRPPRQEKSEKFEISGEQTLAIDLTSEIVTKSTLTGHVHTGEDKHPLADARIVGVTQRFSGQDWQATTDKEGVFIVERTGEPSYVYASSADNSLAAIAILPGDQNTLQLSLEKTGTVEGILLQTDSQKPASDTKIAYGIQVPDENKRTWSYRFGGSTVTDSEGRFKLEGLVPGWEYQLNLEPQANGMITSLTTATVSPSQNLKIGKHSIPAAPKPYVPPTLDERIARAMGVDGAAMERFQRAIPRCKLNKQKLLIVFGSPDDPQLQQFMKLRYEDKDFRQLRDHFLIMAVSSQDRQDVTEANALLSALSAVPIGAENNFSIVIVGQQGELIAQKSSADLVDAKEELSKELVIQWLQSHLGEPIDGKILFDETLARAKKENKHVLVQETATWCGPCHMLSDFLNEHQQWQSDYIWLKMDHRFTGAREIMAELRDGSPGGIPWFAILDADGKILATSNHFETGDNIGFPSNAAGQAHFKKMLRDTRLSMTDEQIEALVAHLKNDAQ
ncbi:thioredoxin domain-containing protein [Rosistilla oblonga]|uniref:thioredoxin domain-containing protein n=1 Tax=Rosistilla oblonga TaxID=2527990 RepID=UPI003A9744A2